MSKGKAKANAQQAPIKSLKELGIETYTVEEVHRSALVNALYNPRKITDGERDKLKKAIAKHGVVAPITWNRRTGNIVGGHQRISITDTLAKTSDYRLNVAAIDVDDKREREINVLLNNQAAAGDWDYEALRNIFSDDGVTLEGSGFDQTDFVNLFGTDVFNERSADLASFAEKMSAVGQTYDAVTKANVEKAEKEPFLVLVFPDGAACDAFREAAGIDGMRYQSGMRLLELLKNTFGVVAAPKKGAPRRARTARGAPADPGAPS